jgi:hypothetical protein
MPVDAKMYRYAPKKILPARCVPLLPKILAKETDDALGFKRKLTCKFDGRWGNGPAAAQAARLLQRD